MCVVVTHSVDSRGCIEKSGTNQLLKKKDPNKQIAFFNLVTLKMVKEIAIYVTNASSP